MNCPICYRNYTTLINNNKSEYYCFACNTSFYLKYTNLNNPESKIRTLEQVLNKLSYDIYDLKYIENSNKIVKQFYTFTKGKGLTKTDRYYILLIHSRYLKFLISNNKLTKSITSSTFLKCINILPKSKTFKLLPLWEEFVSSD